MCFQLKLLGTNFACVPDLFTKISPSRLSPAKFQNVWIIWIIFSSFPLPDKILICLSCLPGIWRFGVFRHCFCFYWGRDFFFSYNKFWVYCQLSPQGPDLVDSHCSCSTSGMYLNRLRRNYLGHRIKNKYFHKSRVKSSAHIQFCLAPSCDYICNF